MIYLVRHLEKEHSMHEPALEMGYLQYTKTIPLTAIGREHTTRVGNFLRKRTRDPLILSSEYTRARESATIIADLLHTHTSVDTRLAERQLCADRSTPEQITAYNIRSLTDWAWSAPGGESMQTVAARMKQAIEQAQELVGTDRDIIFISHSRSIQALLGAYYEDTKEGRELKSDPLPVIKYGAVVEISTSQLVKMSFID